MHNPFDNPVILRDMQEICDASISSEKLYGSTVLITGAYGMLASYICLFFSYLNEYEDKRIHIVAQGRDYDKMQRRYGVLCDKSFFDIRIGNIKDVLSDETHIDFIIHTAGVADPQKYASIPVEVAKCNTIDLYELLQIACKCNTKRFLFFSSGDVYGRMPDNTPITENKMGVCDPLSDHACYTESKRMGETFCRDFWREYGVDTVIARIGHTYGPTMDIHNDSRVFSSFMNNLLNKENIVIHSNGLAKRPFCYITDAVIAYLLLLFEGASGEAYNVCNTKEFLSINELAEIIAKLDETKRIKVVHSSNDNNTHVENKENRDNMPISQKLIDLGWNCKVDASEGFRRVYDYNKIKGDERT